MIVVVVDILAAPLTLPREYIQVLKWLVGIDMMVVHMEDSCMEREDQTEVSIHTPARVVEKVGN